MNNIIKVSTELCTGCGACANICPVDAIVMEYNAEGFLRPVVKDNCINCGKCLKACPVLNPLKPNHIPESYAVWADEETRMKSSSGGFFSVLARHVLENGGVVCGAAFSEGYLSVEHKWAETEEQLAPLRGSKYVQSSTGTTYSEAKRYLDSGRMVLYTGCPCQIAGLKSYLGKEYNNLFTADIICHGVPSPKVYQSYITEKSEGSSIIKMDFREKAYWGWGTATSLFMDNGKVYRNDCYKDPYWKGFLGGIITRKSCGECPYANINRIGDFTIGDFWGVKDIDADCDDRKGTSLVLLNNDKAKKLFNSLKTNCILAKKISIDAVIEGAKTRNRQLLHPTKSHRFRERFFKEYIKTPESFFSTIFEENTKKYDIGYVGWWDSRNYGSALTSFAMNRTLKNLGKSVLMLQHPGIAPGKNTDESFGVQFARHFCDCSEITNDKNFRKFNDMCDTFLVGSDQLWNWWNINNGHTGYYFLDFVNNNHKKIAYATSFGSDWTSYPETWRLRVGYLMSKFDAISVREKSGVSICENDFNVAATHVLDPVFLCDMDSYKEVIALSKCEEKDNYVFSYILDPTEDKVNMVKAVAEKLNLPYKIAIDALRNNDKNTSKYLEDLIKSDPNIITALRIEDWLYYISNSSFVATDSFHGFCYSIIFQKPMIAYINARRGKARFDSIAAITGLEDRVITSFEEIGERKLLDKDIDFKSVEEKLNVERIFSKKWLENALDARKKDPSVQELALWKILEHDRKINAINTDSYLKELKELKSKVESLEKKKINSFISKLKVNYKKRKAYYKKNGLKLTIKKIFDKLLG